MLLWAIWEFNFTFFEIRLDCHDVPLNWTVCYRGHHSPQLREPRFKPYWKKAICIHTSIYKWLDLLNTNYFLLFVLKQKMLVQQNNVHPLLTAFPNICKWFSRLLTQQCCDNFHAMNGCDICGTVFRFSWNKYLNIGILALPPTFYKNLKLKTSYSSLIFEGTV